jgi:nucleotide-binding universal stress UspA family protein
MYKHILIPTDGSDLAAKAVAQGLALAKAVGANVTILAVVQTFHVLAFNPPLRTDTQNLYVRHAQEVADTALRAAVTVANQVDVPCNVERVEHDLVYQAIIQSASTHGCDLIVMASHGRGGISAVLLGSVTLKVLTHTRIPVLVCR